MSTDWQQLAHDVQEATRRRLEEEARQRQQPEHKRTGRRIVWNDREYRDPEIEA